MDGPLALEGMEACFRSPLVVAERYIPGAILEGEPVGGGISLDTDRVPDASRLNPPVLLPGLSHPVYDVVLQGAPILSTCELLGRQEVQALIDAIKTVHPALVKGLIPNALQCGEVQKVLQNLVKERVSIRDLVSICKPSPTTPISPKIRR